ncbi:hypothetical protein N018_05050 [Pseudomonas syringae CC1557]|uniref:Uncharacterized protein n=1 Tax=Pseudomonas syringae CC1557 TaxID=1357279 RepID=W0MY44_PSESX|nr:hypothetical protein N018_05050 [Pseudomonas syringae CC1557]
MQPSKSTAPTQKIAPCHYLLLASPMLNKTSIKKGFIRGYFQERAARF